MVGFVEDNRSLPMDYTFKAILDGGESMTIEENEDNLVSSIQPCYTIVYTPEHICIIPGRHPSDHTLQFI